MDASPDPTTPPARILLVDADGRVRRGLRALIETQPDMEVVGEADSSAAAVERARALHPSVIVLDLMLPTAQAGLATVRRVARRKQVCVVTSWQGGLRDVALAMGARGFLEKGESPACLLKVIRAAVQSALLSRDPNGHPAQWREADGPCKPSSGPLPDTRTAGETAEL
ncbi:MAG: response regulator transcription factor [Chloroflexi bacterium]|nr:response regulator transcription factor [Chloroflexota bacterium]